MLKALLKNKGVPKLESLDLTCCQLLENKSLVFIFKYGVLKNLKEFNIQFTKINALKMIGNQGEKYQSKIEKLNFAGIIKFCPGQEKDFNLLNQINIFKT